MFGSLFLRNRRPSPPSVREDSEWSQRDLIKRMSAKSLDCIERTKRTGKLIISDLRSLFDVLHRKFHKDFIISNDSESSIKALVNSEEEHQSCFMIFGIPPKGVFHKREVSEGAVLYKSYSEKKLIYFHSHQKPFEELEKVDQMIRDCFLAKHQEYSFESHSAGHSHRGIDLGKILFDYLLEEDQERMIERFSQFSILDLKDIAFVLGIPSSLTEAQKQGKLLDFISWTIDLYRKRSSRFISSSEKISETEERLQTDLPRSICAQIDDGKPEIKKGSVDLKTGESKETQLFKEIFERVKSLVNGNEEATWKILSYVHQGGQFDAQEQLTLLFQPDDIFYLHNFSVQGENYVVRIVREGSKVFIIRTDGYSINTSEEPILSASGEEITPKFQAEYQYTLNLDDLSAPVKFTFQLTSL